MKKGINILKIVNKYQLKNLHITILIFITSLIAVHANSKGLQKPQFLFNKIKSRGNNKQPFFCERLSHFCGFTFSKLFQQKYWQK